jgi:hypothetical protein
VIRRYSFGGNAMDGARTVWPNLVWTGVPRTRLLLYRRIRPSNRNNTTTERSYRSCGRVMSQRSNLTKT